MSNNYSLISEAWNFLKVRKKWWLLPIIISLIIAGTIILFGQSSSLSPILYAFG